MFYDARGRIVPIRLWRGLCQACREADAEARADDLAKNPHAVALGSLGGKAGGISTSKKKAAAARRNGKKGGRPKLEPSPR